MSNSTSNQIKPKSLHRGDTLGIVCPSRWVPEENLRLIQKIYEKHGYRIKYGKSPFLRYNQFAGTPEERAKDISDMFADPEIDGIICARGGYGANRVIPLLDYDVIKQNPKIFMGYSDITALLYSIYQQTGLITFHGPMFVTYKKGFIPYNWECWESVVSGKSKMEITNPPNLKPNILTSGFASGPLMGGNLTLIVNRLGTSDQIDFDGSILFLEDIDEYLYAYDRYLVHLRQSGTVEKIKGLIIGELIDMKDDEIPFGKTPDEIILDVFGDLDIPIVTNVACGHGQYQMTLPVSHPVTLNVSSDSFTLSWDESPVI